MKLFVPAALAALLAAPGAFAAEVMYRSVMPDGSVRYGESPDPGAKTVRKIPPPPISTGTITVTPQETSQVQRLPSATGGAAVLPMPDRKPPAAAEQGKLQSPPGLPSRGY